MTILTTTAACTRRLLGKTAGEHQWARMKINRPSHEVLNSPGTAKKRDDPNTQQCLSKPVKSLGRWYNASLRDKDQVQQVRQDFTNSLETSTDPTAREAQALVPAIWTSPSGNVATNYLRAPNNNCGEDGGNHDFIREEMARCPTLSD